MESSQFVTDAEIKRLLDDSAKRLYDMVLREFGTPPHTAYAVLFTLSGSNIVQLPDDFYMLLGVQAQYNNQWMPLRPLQLETTARDFNAQNAGFTPPTSYRLTGFQYGENPPELGSQIPPSAMLEITPYASDVQQTLLVTYVPTVRNDATGGSDVYYEGYNGWEEWMVLRAACFCLSKEESDCSFYQGEMAKIEAEIRALAGRRDGAQPQQLRDVLDECGGFDPRFPRRLW